MAKNITVIDENNNITGSTYPKRANGLVKKGRAHWGDENTIMMRIDHLNDESEAVNMADNIYEVFDNQVSKIQEQLRSLPHQSVENVQIQILKSMEAMRKTDYAFRTLEIVNSQLTVLQENMKGECPAELLPQREITRQKMVELMESLVSPSVLDEYEIIEDHTDGDIDVANQYVFED